MKKLFTAIRKRDYELVKDIINKKPELVNCTAKQPPKKDDGQSLLQVALKTGNFHIADFLIDNGANLNFMEVEGCNEWKMPVLHDAIRAAIMNSRYLEDNFDGTWKIAHSKQESKYAYKILEKIIDLGAEVKCYDSYDNSTIGRAILDARQILPTVNHSDSSWVDFRPLNDELIEDLKAIFDLLIKNGGDVDEIDPKLEMTYREYCQMEPVYQFIK
ncbi:MAG: ankyrin repeat domain-containing protein [Tepidibacter sp.]|jgi:hypothetical protein|uniref:ankyrin repeat domain-containing protein n=1 Tax=Tepidibacter sp. TaxID=2529387 RepID=UPI0025EACB69|nr:ankyrin repeat domain-containing protein [Tepidibacter sp.]MCT4509855.1 ankyrin repeat domain-containing protein [Tepidibacter sp.]